MRDILLKYKHREPLDYPCVMTGLLHHPGRGRLGACFLLGLMLLGARVTGAQTPLFRVDNETTIRSLSFRFDSTRTFTNTQLLAPIATTTPGFSDRVKRVLPFLKPKTYPLSILELQRDVVRLRRYYNRNGFSHARVGYASSRLDTAKNAFDIIFSIEEGPPLTVQEVLFFTPDGQPFPDPQDARHGFRNAITVEGGDRYAEFERVRTRDQALSWMKDHGYAFARINDTVVIDSSANTASLRFTVDPGPLTYFDEIDVEGNTSVSRNVILRELPFRAGQRFSNGRLTQGQRELFALNLFRTALTDVPEQPRDSTVRIRVRVREGRPQLLSYRAGYGRQTGLALQGDWTHRNAFGGARTFTTGLVANTGLLASAGERLPPRLFRGSVALRQPYLFTTKLSGAVSLFTQFERDPQLPESDEPLGINEREIGTDASLLYEMLPFRTITVQYTWSRALQLTGTPEGDGRTRDLFNRGALTISGLFGKSDDYINPTRGFLARPFFEVAERRLGSDVRYYKLGAELNGYTVPAPRVGLAGRLFVGRLWPQGESRDQESPAVENRFDQVRFYAGGSNDLRGWATQLAGPKFVRTDVSGGDTSFVYEAMGGLTKLAANVELRLPFPGLSSDWGTAVFADAGRLSEGDVALSGFRLGTGVGIRYRTPVGFLRLDLAYKINPDAGDLRSAEAFFRQGEQAPSDRRRRFALHLSIGQAF